MTKNIERMNDYSEQVAKKFIDLLKEGAAPFQKPWKAGELREEPFNPITMKSYRGINNLTLSTSEFNDPRWMTYKQASQADYQVIKGSKSTPIEYWQWTNERKVIDENGVVQKDAEGNDLTETIKLDKPRVFYANVFNATQIEGIEPYVKPVPENLTEQQREAERILASLKIPISHDQKDRAYYNFAKDEIHLPVKDSFVSKEAYYATALHELGHATGHESRLNRDMSGGFGSEKYAREELRAEIASYMLNTKLGLGHDPSQHASYVGSWIKELENDPREIFRAAKDADIIQTYLTQPELRQKLEQSTQNIITEKAERVETMHNRVYLNIPYENTEGRKAVKAAGGRYDRKARSWYIPEGKPESDFKAFDRHDPLNKPKVSAEVSFRDFLADNGFKPKGEVDMTASDWKSIPLSDQKGGKESGSYKVFGDAVKTIVAQNNKTGEQFRLTHTGQELTSADRREIAKDREKQNEVNAQLRQDAYDKAGRRAQAIINTLQSASTDHPYLQDKNVRPFFIKQTQGKEGEAGRLAVPLRNIEGEIRTIQYINDDGSKMLMKGGQKTGNFHRFDPDNDIISGKASTVIIAEGYATAATLHQITHKAVVAAIDANNLKPVAEAIRKHNPLAKIVIASDNDHSVKIDGKPVNVGLDKAQEAAKAVDGKVILPQFTQAEKANGYTDFNDLHKSRGDAAVQIINSAVAQSFAKAKEADMVM